MTNNIPAPRLESRASISARYLADIESIESLRISRRAKRRMIAERYAEYSSRWNAAPMQMNRIR